MVGQSSSSCCSRHTFKGWHFLYHRRSPVTISTTTVGLVMSVNGSHAHMSHICTTSDIDAQIMPTDTPSAKSVPCMNLPRNSNGFTLRCTIICIFLYPFSFLETVQGFVFELCIQFYGKEQPRAQRPLEGLVFSFYIGFYMQEQSSTQGLSVQRVLYMRYLFYCCYPSPRKNVCVRSICRRR